MATKLLIGLVLLPVSVWAQSSSAERAAILNEEMNFLMNSARQVQVYAAPDASSTLDMRQRRNGIAPSQMPGVERTENRYFSDEVNFQAAASDRISDEPEEGSEYDQEAAEDGFTMDGTRPKRSR